LCVHPLVTAWDPSRAITGALPDRCSNVVFSFAPILGSRRQQRPRIDVNQPQD
jgi:hypothetical protein